MIQVRVFRLDKDAVTDSPVVLLQAVGEKRVLPIWIGHAEASAIDFQLAGRSFERPLTHDLLRLVIEGFDARVQKVVITELKGNTFFAQILLARGDEILAIDARPSDSIALALRTRAPLFVASELFKNNSREIVVLAEPEPEEEAADDEAADDPLKEYLDEPDPPDNFNL